MLGIEIQKSILERSNIEAAMHNSKNALKYLKDCKKMFAEHEDKDVLISSAERALMHEYEESMLGREQLANKYYELKGEKFFKLKLQIEKELGI